MYGDWSDCVAGQQTRTKQCVCAGTLVDSQKCVQLQMLPEEQKCALLLQSCEFVWSKWSVCTAACNGGNMTRIPECFCNGQTENSVPNHFCNMQEYFGRETVPCNQFACGHVPALNKIYWMSRIGSINWPIVNYVFNCTRGYDPEDSPKGKTYSEILADPSPSSHKNYLWYYLAKEWVVAQLNIANGVKFPVEALQVIKEVGKLLEKCDGYSVEDPLLYSLKEKLGRLNNNIGGLSNVDVQTAMMTAGSIMAGKPGNEIDGDHNSRLTFILAIAVPVAAVMIIAFALGLTVYYVRDRTTVAKEEFESEDDEPLQNTLIMSESKPVDVMPLEDQTPVPVTKDDSEEQLL